MLMPEKSRPEAFLVAAIEGEATHSDPREIHRHQRCGDHTARQRTSCGSQEGISTYGKIDRVGPSRKSARIANTAAAIGRVPAPPSTAEKTLPPLPEDSHDLHLIPGQSAAGSVTVLVQTVGDPSQGESLIPKLSHDRGEISVRCDSVGPVHLGSPLGSSSPARCGQIPTLGPAAAPKPATTLVGLSERPWSSR
ncbi:hypothetical protein VT03_17195 [Planctomyces sp. SH-PL14]|nr:hypothetical protein VT03_17195 [Planctomyces sp. SH-PL14]